MNKKIYKQPSMKVKEIDRNHIICGSPGGPTPMSLNEDVGEYGEDERPTVSRDIWGSQW